MANDNTNNNKSITDIQGDSSKSKISGVISEIPSSISDAEKRQLFRELTILLTRSWEENGKRLYGCAEEELLLITQFDIFTLKEILAEYGNFIEILGLELRTYEMDKKLFYCLRSRYYAPPELSDSELIVLGVIIALRELEKDVTTQLLKEKLVVTKKLSNYQLGEALRKLTKLGYIQSKRRKWDYNYRLLVEFDDEEKKKIVNEYEMLWVK